MLKDRYFVSFYLHRTAMIFVVHFLLLICLASGLNYPVDECRRLHRPVIDVPKTPGDNGFRLKIAQDLDTYLPGQNYTSECFSYWDCLLLSSCIGSNGDKCFWYSYHCCFCCSHTARMAYTVQRAKVYWILDTSYTKRRKNKGIFGWEIWGNFGDLTANWRGRQLFTSLLWTGKK